MMQKEKIRNLVKWIFYATTIVSLVLLIPPTVNYREFYVAMGNLIVREDWFSYVEINEGERVQVNAQFTLIHNSSYVGLKIHSVILRVYYEDRQEALVGMRFWFNDKSLDPYSEIQLLLSENATIQASEDFLELKTKGVVHCEVRTTAYVYVFSGYDPTAVHLDVVPLDL